MLGTTRPHAEFMSLRFFPPNGVATLGVLAVIVIRPAVHSRWYHACAGFLMTLTAQKFPCEMSMCTSTAQAGGVAKISLPKFSLD